MKINLLHTILLGSLFLLSSLSGVAETAISKGDPVQIITSDRESIVGELNSAIDAENINVLSKEGSVEIEKDRVVEIRLLKDDAKTQWRNEIAVGGSRGAVDATAELSSLFTTFFTERDIRTSSGFTSFAQVILDQIHPTTTFKRLRMNQVKVTYVDGRPRTYENIRETYLRMTLYWDGWIQKDGYTQISIIWDSEVERWKDLELISSSGMTNDEAVETSIAVGALIGLLMSE